MKTANLTSLTTTVSNTTRAANFAQSSLPSSNSLRRIGSILTLIVILCLGNCQLFAQAASESAKALIVPPLINYSGVLKNSAGEPLSGVVGATFYIYKDSEGGAPLWMETQNLQLDASGHYSVMLGSTTSHGLPDDLFAFGVPRWLSVQVQGEQEQPRTLLVAVPYALKAADAATIGGLPPSAFVRSTPDGASSTSGSGSASQSALSSSSSSSPGKSLSPLSPCSGLTGAGTTNYLPLWTTACNLGNSNVFQSGSNVGIGTTSPGALLDVNGNINTATAYQIENTTVVGIGSPSSWNLFLGVGAGANSAPGRTGVNLFSGYQAGYNNTTGLANVFEGGRAGYSNTTGSYNVFEGVQAGSSNISGGNNVFEGYQAGSSNTAGGNNVFEGYQAGSSNINGGNNVFEGYRAGYFNTTGSYNVFEGYQAGSSNTSGGNNVFEGYQAGSSNINGPYNVFSGSLAGASNSSGNGNVFVGYAAGSSNTTGSGNAFVGFQAGLNTTGGNNVFVGQQAGYSTTTGSNDIYIGSVGNNPGESNTIRIGSAGSQNTTFIAGIYGVNNAGVPVYINAGGQLGTTSSSRRFKDNILDMNDSSSKLYQLRPVTFYYKPQYDDGNHSLQYGLIAEEVAEIYPEMVAYDKDGKPYTVKYQLLAPMLLNELQKEHKVVSEQQGQIADLQQRLSRLESLTAKK